MISYLMQNKISLSRNLHFRNIVEIVEIRKSELFAGSVHKWTPEPKILFCGLVPLAMSWDILLSYIYYGLYENQI